MHMTIADAAQIKPARLTGQVEAVMSKIGPVYESMIDASAIKTEDGKSPVAFVIPKGGLDDPAMRQAVESSHERLYNENGHALVINLDNPDVAISSSKMMRDDDISDDTSAGDADSKPVWVVHSLSMGGAFPFSEKEGEPGRAHGETTDILEAMMAAKVYDYDKTHEQNRDALDAAMKDRDNYQWANVIYQDEKLWITPISYYESSENAVSIGPAKEMVHDLTDDNSAYLGLKNGNGLVGQYIVDRSDDPNKVIFLGGEDLMSASVSEMAVARLAVEDAIAGRPYQKHEHAVPEFPQSKGPAQLPETEPQMERSANER